MATSTKAPVKTPSNASSKPASKTTAEPLAASKPSAKTPSKPASRTTVQPLADRVAVRANERESMTVSGIVLPDTAKEKPQEGTVVAVGPGRLNEAGKRVALEIKTGDTVLYARYAGSEIKIAGEDLLILRETDILAVLK